MAHSSDRNIRQALLIVLSMVFTSAISIDEELNRSIDSDVALFSLSFTIMAIVADIALFRRNLIIDRSSISIFG